MADKAKQYVAEGYKAIKMQCGHMYTAREDVANVRKVRDAVGQAVTIAVDGNGKWDLPTFSFSRR